MFKIIQHDSTSVSVPYTWCASQRAAEAIDSHLRVSLAGVQGIEQSVTVTVVSSAELVGQFSIMQTDRPAC